MNSSIEIMPKALVPSSSRPDADAGGGLQIVVDNIHKCSATVECKVGKI
jgi:hypothetical protein